MSRKNLLNLFLLIIAAALASIVFFSETSSDKLAPLSTIDITAIKKITIQHNTHTTLIESQRDGHWKLRQPVEIDANDFRINSILKLVNAPVHSHYPLSDIDAETIGLDDPATKITFDDHTISFGSINPATGLRYVQLDNTIYTIEDIYYPLISSNFSALVSLNLLPVDSHIDKLILINQTITRGDDGLWRSNIAITADDVAGAIDHWQTLQAFGVHRYLERKQLGEVFIYLTGQQQALRYLITDTDPWLIIARPETGLEYHLDIGAYDQLLAPQ
ncbi:MAG TPA: DUF4340 domain-containing protein [Gammaproteobacteria bacterium]|nr:DUF4340 domain-containing protein [Gammaproteobacteria bacterium]